MGIDIRTVIEKEIPIEVIPEWVNELKGFIGNFRIDKIPCFQSGYDAGLETGNNETMTSRMEVGLNGNGIGSFSQQSIGLYYRKYFNINLKSDENILGYKLGDNIILITNNFDANNRILFKTHEKILLNTGGIKNNYPLGILQSGSNVYGVIYNYSSIGNTDSFIYSDIPEITLLIKGV